MQRLVLVDIHLVNSILMCGKIYGYFRDSYIVIEIKLNLPHIMPKLNLIMIIRTRIGISISLF